MTDQVCQACRALQGFQLCQAVPVCRARPVIQLCRALLCLPPDLSFHLLPSPQEVQKVPWVQGPRGLLTQPLPAWQPGPQGWCPQGVQEVQGGQVVQPFPPYLASHALQGCQVYQWVPELSIL